MSNDERITSVRHASSSFVIRISFVIRPSCFVIPDAAHEQEQKHEHEQEKLAHAGWLGSHLSSGGLGFVLVVMRAAEEWDFVEHVLLEPFEPQIDDWCDE
jgi:hypothetical protein